MLFNRTATVVIGPKAGGSGIDVRGLSLAFEITKDASASPNVARVTIRNLSQQTRDSIREHQSKFILSVGYETEDESVIFQGDVDTVEHKVQPPEVESTLTCGDGRAAIRNTRLSLSLEPGCTVGQACKVVADRMGLGIDDFGGGSATLPNGFAFVGPADSAMRQLAATGALEYSVQNGRVQLIKRSGLRPGTGFLISPNTGLIGSPERVIKPDGKLEKDVPRVQWAFRCLLNPRLQVTERVRIESAEVNGIFRLEKIRHVGDTHAEEPWFSECQVSAQ